MTALARRKSSVSDLMAPSCCVKPATVTGGAATAILHTQRRGEVINDRREGALFGTHYVMISGTNSGRGQFRGGRGM